LTRVAYGLAVGLHGQANIRAHQMIRARMAWDSAAVMVGQAQAERGNSQLI
jgi:hypothetical protein